MLKIEYEIKLNEQGRPCIDLANDYEDKPEDKFFSIELARYILQDVYNRKSAEFDKDASTMIENGINLLGQVGDQLAELLWNSMKAYGDTELLWNRNYHVIVDNIEERDNLKYTGILEGERIYLRQEGLKVLVKDENKIYELVGGNNNENWEEVK